jgi:hypothetical protein
MFSSRLRILKTLGLILAIEIAIFVLFLFAPNAHAQVNEPIFTTGENFADKVTAIGTTTTEFGNLYYRVLVNEDIDGCISTSSPQLRRQNAQWFGSSWVLSGGGGTSSCFGGDNFILASTTMDIRVNSASDGYFCQFYGSGGVTLTETNHIKHVCVLQTNGGLSYELIETQVDFVVSPLNFETKFINAIISGASTTLEFDVEYYLNTDEYTPTTRPDIIQINILKDGFFNDQQVALEQRFILPLTNGFHFRNIDFDHAFQDGNYIAYVNFWNLNSNNFTFSETNIILNFEIAGGLLVDSEILEITNGENIGEQIKYENCSFTNIYGCIINALIYLFVPSASAFDPFFDLAETVDNKPPFGFYTATIEALEISTSSDAFTMPDLPFQNEIFDPFKNLLGSVMIFGYIFFFTTRAYKIIV